jgi:hypothetical protein
VLINRTNLRALVRIARPVRHKSVKCYTFEDEEEEEEDEEGGGEEGGEEEEEAEVRRVRLFNISRKMLSKPENLSLLMWRKD